MQTNKKNQIRNAHSATANQEQEDQNRNSSSDQQSSEYRNVENEEWNYNGLQGTERRTTYNPDQIPPINSQDMDAPDTDIDEDVDFDEDIDEAEDDELEDIDIDEEDDEEL